MSQHNLTLTVNGKTHRAEIPARLTLVDFLRDVLRLTGTHVGCEHGVRSCLLFAVQAEGAAITTVEGLAPDGEALGVLQDSFCETHALQCGYCTPGMLIAAEALLREIPDPTERDIREAISGNLCRCTGYKQIVEAVALAARRLRGSNEPPEPHHDR